MGKPYTQEIDHLADTCDWSFLQEVEELSRLLSRWSDGPLIVVGSGGSYSAASTWASFHRAKYGQPSYASTPLELSDLLCSLKQCRVLLLSAEGKNNDILNSAKLARALDIPCAAVTLTLDNPLTQFSISEKSLHSFAFEMDWVKDGYLATNTLLATILLAARAYFKTEKNTVSHLVAADSLSARRNGLKTESGFSDIRNAGALLLHGPESALFAIDLESKLTEAALAKCEVTDYRQFSHGRHLQLAQDAHRIPVTMCAFTPSEEALADAMIALFPSVATCIKIPILSIGLVERSILALVEAFLVTERIGNSVGIDPGQPDVPEFGRKIYALDSIAYQPRLALPEILDVAVQRKVSDARVSIEDRQLFKQAASDYLVKINRGCFKALICDFDGTLCHAHERYSGMNVQIAQRLIELVQRGLPLGIATGRGRSVIENLRKIFPQTLWNRIWVGPYSGSVVKKLEDSTELPETNPDLFQALDWLKSSALCQYGREGEDKCRVGQLSLRVGDHIMASRIAFALNNWITATGRIGWRVFSSGHSVDLLDPTASKINVVNHMALELGIDPVEEILRVGDAGHSAGNDFELLRDALSLSVDRVSDSLTSCWNFSPSGVRQADATYFYLQLLTVTANGTQIALSLNGNLHA